MAQSPTCPVAGRRTWPSAVLTTAPTLLVTKLSRTMLGGASVPAYVRIPVGTLLILQSIRETDPTPCVVIPPLPLMLKAIEPPSTSICCQLKPQTQLICTA